MLEHCGGVGVALALVFELSAGLEHPNLSSVICVVAYLVHILVREVSSDYELLDLETITAHFVNYIGRPIPLGATLEISRV